MKKLQSINEKYFFNPKLYKWIFISSLIALAFYYHFAEIIFLRPAGIHIWRQCECLSITMNYFYNSMNFFQPAIHNQISDGGTSGLSAGEFPLLYYFIAILWKVFGHHEYIYRLVVLIIAFIGLYCLYRTLEDILKDSFWAIFLTLLLYTSPIAVFYSINFITNIPAFSFVLIGWHFFYRFYKSSRNHLLWLALFFFMIAGLLKISSAISFLLILFIYISDTIRLIKYKPGQRIFTKPLRQFMPFLLFIIVVAVWYIYAIHFNNIHGGNYTTNSIFPIWAMQYDEIIKVWDALISFLIKQIFSIPLLILSGVMFFAVIVLSFFKKVQTQAIIVLMVLFMGTAAYFLLWYSLFDIHDYYLIELLPLFVFTFAIFFHYLKFHLFTIFNHIIFRLLIVVFLIYNAKYVPFSIG